MTDERTKLLKKVQMYSFATHDAALFLDTHPQCKHAMDYYDKYSKLYSEAKTEYENLYGLLTLPQETSSVWKWINDPWPWEERESE